MESEINLLKTDKKVKEKKSSFFKLCISVLMIVVFITASEMLYTFYLKNRLSGVISDQSAALNQIVSIDAKRVKFQTLKERLLAVNKILPARKIFKERVEIVTQSIPANVTVDSFTISEKGIELRVSSKSLSSINTFLDEGLPAISKQKQQPVSKIAIGSVGVSKNPAGYMTSATITF